MLKNPYGFGPRFVWGLCKPAFWAFFLISDNQQEFKLIPQRLHVEPNFRVPNLGRYSPIFWGFVLCAGELSSWRDFVPRTLLEPTYLRVSLDFFSQDISFTAQAILPIIPNLKNYLK
jgi:hypothetical protein